MGIHLGNSSLKGTTPSRSDLRPEDLILLVVFVFGLRVDKPPHAIEVLVAGCHVARLPADVTPILCGGST